MGQCCSQQVTTAPNGLKPMAIPASEANNDEQVNGRVAENGTNGFRSGSSFNEPSVLTSTWTNSFDSSPSWSCKKPSPSKHIQAKRSYNDIAKEENFEDEQPKCLDKNFGYARNFSVTYELGPEVGRGHFGYTCYATVKSGEFQGQTVAVKIISKSEMPSEREIEDVRREVKILKALSGHPNLVQFYDAYEDHDRVYIVMELCSGGELLDHILTRGGRYEEDEAKAIVAQMLHAVSFIHLQGVVHRDLKPENFLFSKQDDISVMKAIDFGLSDFLNADVMLTDIVGSAYYVAPEVLEQSYGTEADVWSIGVIVYILLSGNRPFWAQTESGIFCAVRQAIPDYDEMPWPTVSDQAKDFVKRLLTKDPKKRLTAAQALTHPWLRGNQKAPLDMVTLKLVKSYLESSSLRRSALKALAKTLTEEDFYFLGAQFMLLRPEKDGGITLENFKMALLKSATEAMKESHAWRILKSMTALSLHKMYFHEFCAAAMNVHQLTMSEDWHYNLQRAYEHFEKKGNRVVSVQELAEEMQIPETVPASTFLHDWMRLEDGKLSLKGFTKLLLA